MALNLIPPPAGPLALEAATATTAPAGSGEAKRKRRRVNPNGNTKAFQCDWDGCNKAFSRADHLNRHRLNHAPSQIFHCDRCSKTFVREDLLVRHTERHEKRENGAGEPRGPLRKPAPPAPPSTQGPPSHQQQHHQASDFQLDPSPQPQPPPPPQWPSQGVQDLTLPFLAPSNPDQTPSSHYDFNIPQPSPYASALVVPSFGSEPSNSAFDSFSDVSTLNPFGDLDFVNSSYNAPYASASQHSWLFTGDDFDVTLAISRPASPGHDSPDDTLGLAFANGLQGLDFGGGNRFNNGWPPAEDKAPEVEATLDPQTNNASPPPDPSCFITAEVRDAMVDYLGPEWSGLRTDARFSVEILRDNLALFWERIHDSQAPAIHRATFRAANAPAPLLLAMISLGSYFGDAGSHHLSTKIHPSLRGKVFSSNDFRPRPDNWLHQSVLLIMYVYFSMFGKLCSNRAGHEMGQVFWSSVITLARRSGIFSQRTVPVPEEYKDNVERQWAAWIEEESAKRVALIGFSIDVQHAALFRHTPSLSAFQLQLMLPCDEDEWEAPTAAEWKVIHDRQRPPVPFLSALKASLTPGATPPALNHFSRVCVLHGLLSVSQDLGWRDHSLGLGTEGRASNWRDTMAAAFNSWKSRLDTALLTANASKSQLLRASISLYAIAHVTLSVDNHELQIYAGSENALGLIISQTMREATVNRVRVWANTRDGLVACWHACHFLKSSLQEFLQSGVDLSGALHHRWCVYLACLTVYSFTTVSVDPLPRDPDYRNATLRYLDLMCTSSPEEMLMVRNKNNVLCLCETVHAYLAESRWDIAVEGSKLLGRVLDTVSPS
ncbi:zinc finger, C2H2-type domain containing protein, transcription factor [Pseudohyphozyma bogoriensis]|nr:zinc finger, C2H2-type domain containing protein, transcription factor [Pseudohyphozyma bogoriensis]